MLITLIGHRGAGKSRWLELNDNGTAGVEFVDLDRVIEREENSEISKIFKNKGERYFREAEYRVFNKEFARLKEKSGIHFLAIGAGFNFDLPRDAYTVWIQRETDLSPRIFLDRPRLDTNNLPSEEYLSRLESREEKYRKLSDEVFSLPEGYLRNIERDLNLFWRLNSGAPVQIGGILPYPVKLLKNLGKLDFFLSRRRGWLGVSYEFKTNELSRENIIFGLNTINNAIVSYRGPVDSSLVPDKFKNSRAKVVFDWAIELGQCPFSGIDIFSLHERKSGETLSQALERLEAFAREGAQLKAASIVSNFSELIDGFNWQQMDPENRSFLPRSADGRWEWFRLFMKGHQPLNYLREGRGEVLDQPLVFEWTLFLNEGNRFAAVLGDPVKHSLTPSFQSEYFSEIGIPVLRVMVSSQDWQSEAIDVLAKMGLRYAAVTSPLKVLAAETTGNSYPINTMYFDEKNNQWIGTNTDIFGFKKLLEEIPTEAKNQQIAVWGGGGVLPTVEKELPLADFYQASTGKLKRGEGKRPDIVLWAVGRQNLINGTWPPSDWSPHTVVDLNYSDDSPGREYALLTGSKYISGLSMFTEQGLRQREFWSQCGC